jgi:pilus assembly protein CpaE
MSETDKIYQYFSDPVRTAQQAAGSDSMTSNTNSSIDATFADSLSTEGLSIALIGPDELTRRGVSDAIRQGRGNEIREFDAYPADLDEVPKILDQQYDVIIIDLDTNPEYALELVESLCANGSATVMVFSSKPDSEMLVRCMRAGAREFLTPPFAQATMAEALVRAAARRPASRMQKKTRGKLLVFLGAKGGAGVTTLACNFAVALAQSSGQSTLLIDLDLPLGDAALNLGIIAEYSTVNALQDYVRLDAALLEKLIVKHSSGVWVLAAPGRFPSFNASNEVHRQADHCRAPGF